MSRIANKKGVGFAIKIGSVGCEKQSILNIDALDNENDLFNAKGQLHIIRFLLSLEDATKFTLEQSQ